MAVNNNLGDYLQNLANTVRDKGWATGEINAQDIPSKIPTAQTKTVNPSSTTQTVSADSGKALTSVTVGAVTTSIAKSIVGEEEHADPAISIDKTTGVVTASHTQSLDKALSGDATTNATLNLTTQGAATITPGTTSQTAVSADRYTTGAVTVAAVSAATAKSVLGEEAHAAPTVAYDSTTHAVTASHTQTIGKALSGDATKIATYTVTADDAKNIIGTEAHAAPTTSYSNGVVTASHTQTIGKALSGDATKTATYTVTAANAKAILGEEAHAAPTISWNGATATASHTQTIGKALSGDATKTGTSTISTVAATTITPSSSSQTAVASGTRAYFSGAVTVSAISPYKSNGLSASSGGKDNTGCWVYFPYGYYPQYNTTGNSYIYLPESVIGSAAASEVLSGKTFTSGPAGVKVSGTMKSWVGTGANAAGTSTSEGKPVYQWRSSGEGTGLAIAPGAGYWPYDWITTNAGRGYIYIPASTFGGAGQGEVLSGKTFTSSNGLAISGTMTNQGKKTATLNATTTSYTIPAGYHDGTGSVSVGTAAHTAPSGSWNAATYTLSHTQTIGSVVTGDATKTATMSITNQAAKTVTPSSSSQTAISSGTRAYFSGAVTVGAVTAAIAQGVTGTEAHASPTLSWSGATVTASHTQTLGKALTGTATLTGTSTLTTKAATTVTPSLVDQTAIASASRLYFSGALTVSKIQIAYVFSGSYLSNGTHTGYSYWSNGITISNLAYATTKKEQLSFTLVNAGMYQYLATFAHYTASCACTVSVGGVVQSRTVNTGSGNSSTNTTSLAAGTGSATGYTNIIQGVFSISGSSVIKVGIDSSTHSGHYGIMLIKVG